MMLKDLDKTSFLAEFEKFLAVRLGLDRSELDAVARYATLCGGKRVRPTLVYLGAMAAGGECPLQAALLLATQVELIHSYSLVHDDLPAMDDGKVRRGKPTVHVAFGEANAVLGGDILLTYAMCAATEGCQKYGETFARAAAEISEAAARMAHGQAMELAGLSSEKEYLDMYACKTGALIEGALKAGYILAGGATPDVVAECGKNIGVAFQLADDLLDGDGLTAFAGKERTAQLLQLFGDAALNIANGLYAELAEYASMLSRRKR